MLNQMDNTDTKIIKCLLTKKKVHYKDLIECSGFSRTTVSKRLKIIDENLKSIGVHVVRRKGDGIYLTGKVGRLLNEFDQSNHSQNNRLDDLFLLLLFSDHPLKIQEMADKLYVSRNTLQNDLKKMRDRLKGHKLKLHSSAKGLYLSGNELDKRQAMSKIWNSYYQDSNKIQNNADIFDARWGDIFNATFLEKILTLLSQFFTNNHINYVDYQLKDLAIHIAVAIKRIQTHHCLESKVQEKTIPMFKETKNLVKVIEKEFQISLPDSESNYLNLHMFSVINSNLNHVQLKNVTDIKKMLTGILQELQPDVILLNELSLHLVSSLERLKDGLAVRNPYTKKIKDNFPYSFDISVQLASKIQDFYQVVLPEDEIAYIALHVQSFIERKAATIKIDTVIVCNTGLGTSRFLEQRIESEYKNQINVRKVLSLTQFYQTTTKFPLVLTTIPLKDYTGKYVLVSPLLDQLDRTKLDKEIEDILFNEFRQFTVFLDLISPQRIYITTSVKNEYDAISFLGNQLIKQGFAKEGIVNSALNREKMSSTRLQDIATPHAAADRIIKSSISILINKKGIKWQEKKVHLVFFIGLNAGVEKNIKIIFNYFSKLINPDFIQKSLKLTQSQDVYNLIFNYLKEETK